MTLRIPCALCPMRICSQLGQIRRGVDVVVGTPGRLIDVLTLNSCRFTSLKVRGGLHVIQD